MQIVVKRLAYADWCEIEVEPDDPQIEYQKFRELFKILLKNIALIKPVRHQFLQMISQEIESI